MNQDWFEMGDIRRRKLNKSVWVPLRAVQKIQEEGKSGYCGYKEEFFGSGSLAVPIKHRVHAEKLEWGDVGIGHWHGGFYHNGEYTPADIYEFYSDESKITGIHLVLEQHYNSLEPKEWHLHQDLVTTLGLKREGNIWVSANEGYIEVARIHKESDKSPFLLEIRAEHLKDYLCARDMALYVTSYYSRQVVVDDASFIDWKDGNSKEKKNLEYWEGRTREIHEGGFPYGEKWAIHHVARTDVDESDDIPDISEFPTEENTVSNRWEEGFEGRKLFNVLGELWRNEWIEPAKMSPRVKRDELPPTVFFIVDEQGTKENKTTLERSGKWLWFRPDVIMSLAHRRGGFLRWYTRDTGAVGCSPDGGVHFGVNKLGLVNVYAKDIALLPEWQQQVWVGHNIGPEGGVSEELLASQVKAEPAGTQAPEIFLGRGLDTLKTLAREKLNISILREHEFIPETLERTHRFRAVDDSGLFALAKDVARLTAESLGAAAMQTVVPPPKGTKWGSLKSLENLLASKIDGKVARSLTSALVGAYDLRQGDAHLPGSDIDDAFALLKVDRSLPIVLQGYQLLDSCVSSIYRIVKVLENWDVLVSNKGK